MIRHRISLSAVQRRTLQVEVAFDVAAAGSVDVTFPVWTPGSYLIREHARHVHDFKANAPFEKIAKNVYRVHATAGSVTLRYEIYAHELTVRTSHVDSSHAFLNPIGLLPFVPGRESEQQQLEIMDLPAGWAVACGLPVHQSTVTAADYDELIDSPLECGPHAAPESLLRFDMRGVPHEIVLYGRSPLDRTKYAADVARIAEAQAALFGELPYQRYLFIALASDTGRGGLEHRASSALLFPRGSLSTPRGYEDLLSLTSHELFHAWNVKRIKPAAFTPYDLSRENYTRLLWAFEGLTSYYEDLILVRAGLMTRARFLEVLSERLTLLERTQGRHRMPVDEASFDAWIRYYRQDENTDNSAVSYYLKGSLVGLLLDLEIRRHTYAKSSLDDVMRLLWNEYGRVGRGVPEDGVEAACVRVGGDEMQPVLNRALRSTEELPLAEALQALGLKVDRRVAVSAEDRGGSSAPTGKALRSYVGINLRNEGDRVKVASVRRGSPADEAGVCPGDELIAIDDLRADAASSFARLHDHAPGDSIELKVFRRDELLSLRITAAAPVADTWTVTESPDAPPGQRAALTAWLS